MRKKRQPMPKSRYLPGEVDSAQERLDQRIFMEHRANVMNARAKIDNKAPAFNPTIYLKQLKLNNDAVTIMKLDKDNENLLRKINEINRLGGKVDCWNLNVTYDSRIVKDQAKIKRQLTKMNKTMWKRIGEAEAVYSTASLLKEWKLTESKIEFKSRYPLTWKDPRFLKLEAKKQPSVVNELSSFKPRFRPRCFFDVKLIETEQSLGRIVFELYSDFVPRTCEMFLKLCRGDDNGLSYKGTPFHRILPGYWCQGGDVVKFNGSRGDTVYEDSYDENFNLKHAGPGVLSRANGSKFNLTFNRLETMDGKRVVFGKIVTGLVNLYKIEEQGTRSGKPLKKVIVSGCGVFSEKDSAGATLLRQTESNQEETEE